MTDHSIPSSAPAATPVVAGADTGVLATPDEELTAALLAMRHALDSVDDAVDAFHDAADRVDATIAALRASLPTPPVHGPPNPLIKMGAPWRAGFLYGVVPLAPLQPIPDLSTDRWHAITRGTYVGLTKNSAISLNAVTGVSTALSEKHTSQIEALDYFNTALALNAVAVIS
ncbi:hypothetical protein DFH09DRAFT_1096561 [Mycena vulgaris]|nr:hypothetical protein DFH09DRAFT_1096561 [Mycena vulgaris]